MRASHSSTDNSFCMQSCSPHVRCNARPAGCEVIIEVREEHRKTTGYGIQVLIDTRVTKASLQDLQKLGIVSKVRSESCMHAGSKLCPALS